MGTALSRPDVQQAIMVALDSLWWGWAVDALCYRNFPISQHPQQEDRKERNIVSRWYHARRSVAGTIFVESLLWNAVYHCAEIVFKVVEHAN